MEIKIEEAWEIVCKDGENTFDPVVEGHIRKSGEYFHYLVRSILNQPGVSCVPLWPVVMDRELGRNVRQTLYLLIFDKAGS